MEGIRTFVGQIQLEKKEASDRDARLGTGPGKSGECGRALANMGAEGLPPAQVRIRSRGPPPALGRPGHGDPSGPGCLAGACRAPGVQVAGEGLCKRLGGSFPETREWLFLGRNSKKPPN